MDLKSSGRAFKGGPHSFIFVEPQQLLPMNFLSYSTQLPGMVKTPHGSTYIRNTLICGINSDHHI